MSLGMNETRALIHRRHAAEMTDAPRKVGAAMLISLFA